MGFLGNAMGYAGRAAGSAQWAGIAAGTRMMAMGPAGRLGMSAAAGAVYGGTLGRDPGQSRLAGAFSGAMGGAAMYGAARYGRAAYRGARLGSRSLLGGAGMATGVSSRGGMAGLARGAGQGAWGQMRRDARRSMSAIGLGNKLNKPINRVASTLKSSAGITKWSAGKGSNWIDVPSSLKPSPATWSSLPGYSFKSGSSFGGREGGYFGVAARGHAAEWINQGSGGSMGILPRRPFGM